MNAVYGAFAIRSHQILAWADAQSRRSLSGQRLHDLLLQSLHRRNRPCRVYTGHADEKDWRRRPRFADVLDEGGDARGEVVLWYVSDVPETVDHEKSRVELGEHLGHRRLHPA